MVYHGKVNVLVNMTEEFKAACEMFDIEPIAALQFFLDQFSIYSHIAANQGDVPSIASTIVQLFLRSIKIDENVNYKTRQANIDGVRNVMVLIKSSLSSAEKKKQYSKIINKWYLQIKKLDSNGRSNSD